MRRMWLMTIRICRRKLGMGWKNLFRISVHEYCIAFAFALTGVW